MNKVQPKKASPSQIFKDEKGVVSPVINQRDLREMVKEIVEDKTTKH